MSGEGSPASKVPSSAAGPEQVRQFIEGVLISKHELSRKDAADSAKRWGIGCGSELREGNEEIFTSKFGVCDGRSLYRTICEKKLNEWENSVLGKLYYYCWRLAVVAPVVWMFSDNNSKDPESLDYFALLLLMLGAPQLLALSAPDKKLIWRVAWIIVTFAMAASALNLANRYRGTN